MPDETDQTQAPETCISQTKRWRRDLDVILQEMKDYLPEELEEAETLARVSAAMRLTESIMWCGMILKAMNEAQPGAAPDPYPESRDPSSQRVEPTADGLKL